MLELHNSADAIEAWFRGYKESGKSQTIKHTSKDSLEEALSTTGVKKNFVLINFESSEPGEQFEGGQILNMIDTYTVFYRDTAKNSYRNLVNYIKFPYIYDETNEGGNQDRKCSVTGMAQLDDNIFTINIEVK